jgi:hypothetical protein
LAEVTLADVMLAAVDKIVIGEIVAKNSGREEDERAR